MRCTKNQQFGNNPSSWKHTAWCSCLLLLLLSSIVLVVDVSAWVLLAATSTVVLQLLPHGCVQTKLPASAVAPTDSPAPKDCKSPSAAAVATALAAPSMLPSQDVIATMDTARPAAVRCFSGSWPQMSGQTHAVLEQPVGQRCISTHRRSPTGQLYCC